MDIGDKIRKVRELKGYKQEYVAEKVGLSVTAYGNIERNDSSLTFERLEQIAEVLEVTIQDILNIPEHLNIHSVNNAHQVGFNHHTTINDNRVCTEGEAAAYKQSITNLEKEIEYLREQNSKLLNLVGKKQ
jgi:transcriptional regulator with XRE-family HTH domain